MLFYPCAKAPSNARSKLNEIVLSHENITHKIEKAAIDLLISFQQYFNPQKFLSQLLGYAF